MNTILEQQAAIRFDGPLTLACAGELKTMLREHLNRGKDLELDLKHAEEIDITGLQLLWSAAREAHRGGKQFAVRMSQAVRLAAQEAGFDQGSWLAIRD